MERVWCDTLVRSPRLIMVMCGFEKTSFISSIFWQALLPILPLHCSEPFVGWGNSLMRFEIRYVYLTHECRARVSFMRI